MSNDDVSVWLEAEHEYQLKQVAGAVADALLSQQAPVVVPGPVLFSIAERMVSTGVRHGSDWVSVDDAAVVPQWVSKGMEVEQSEVPVIESVGALPESGVAKAVSWSELKL